MAEQSTPLLDATDASERANLASSLGGAVQTSPDQAALAQKYAKALGLPVETVQRNLQAVQKRAALQDAVSATDQAPALRDWAMDPYNAQVSVDQMPHLSALEQTLKWLTSGNKGDFANASDASSLRGIASAIKGVGAFIDNRNAAEGQAGVVVLPGGEFGAPSAEVAPSDGKGGLKFAPMFAGFAAPFERRAAELEAQVQNAKGLGSKIGNVVGGVAPLLLAPEAAPFVMGAQGADRAQQKAEAAGAAYTPAAEAGIGLNALEQGALGAIPFGQFLPRVANPVADLALQVGGHAAVGAATGAGMQAAENATIKGLIDPNQKLDEGVAESAASMALLGTAMHAAHAVPAFAEAHLRDVAKAGEAQTNAAAFESAVDQVRASPMPERSPERFASLLKGMTDADVYVPAEAMRSYLQDLSPEAQQRFGEATGTTDQLASALPAGADVVMKASDYLAHIAPANSEFAAAHDVLGPELRIGSPDAMSAREAGDFHDHYQAFVEQRGEELAQHAQAEADAAEPAQRVFSDVLSQARAAGYTLDAARAYAALYAARYEARAARLNGQAFDANGEPIEREPTDAFQEYQRAGTGGGVRIRREMPAALGGRVDNLDLALDALRAGKKPKGEGPSLLDHLSKAGGLDDAGGELKALDADKWHTEKPFRSRLIRESGHTLGDAAVRAWEAGYFPEHTEEPPSGRDLLHAIHDELRGKVRRPEPESRRPAEFQAAVKELDQALNQLGIDPAKATNAEVRSAIEAHFAQDGEGRSYEQSARGDIRFGDGPAIIRLFRSADLSTALHETGHLFLEELRADAEREDAPQQVKDDYAAVRKWFGIGDGDEIGTEHHEQFARGFETYLMEGKAPAEGLRGAFQRFRSWLVSIYRDIRALNVKVSPEIKGVFDRMIASDDEIAARAEAQKLNPLFASAEDAGMTKAEFAAYTNAHNDAETSARETLLNKLMRDIRRQRTKEWAEERKATKEQVAKEIDARPDVKAWHWLTRGELLGAEEQPGSIRLDRDALVAMKGTDAVLDRMPKAVPAVYTADGGVHPDLLAELVGASSGEKLVDDLMALEQTRRDLREANDRRSVRKYLTDVETNRRMIERHGDMLNDGSIEQEAFDALHDRQRADALGMEEAALARQNGEPTRWTRELLQKFAEDTVSARKVGDLNPAVYLRAERQKGVEAQRALLKGDKVKALELKRQQLLNFHLYRAATDAAAEIAKATKSFNRLAGKRSIASMSQEHLDQIHGLLMRYGFRVPEANLKADYEDWKAEREKAGEAVLPWSPPAARSLEELSVDELRGLKDQVDNLAHLGRLEKQAIVQGRRVALDELTAEAKAKAEALPSVKASNLATPKESRIRKLGYDFAKAEIIADHLDASDPNGPFNRVLIWGASDAHVAENELRRDVMDKIAAARDAVPDDIRRSWLDKIEAPELTNPETGQPLELTRYDLLQVMLNMGSESNFEKMAEGMGWDRAGVERVVDRYARAEEWSFVKSLWDTVGSLWPKIVETERALSGLAPEKVETRTVRTRFGDVDGGYWPLVRDPMRAPDLGSPKDEMEALFNRAFVGVTTPKGFTKARSGASYPISLNLDHVLFDHVNKVTKRIAYGQYVLSAQRFLNEPAIKAIIKEKLGPEAKGFFQDWLKRQVGYRLIDPRAVSTAASFARTARVNTVMVGSALRASVLFEHASAYSQTIGKIGGGATFDGVRRFVSDPMGQAKFVFDRSSEMGFRINEVSRDLRDMVDDLKDDKARGVAPVKAVQHAGHGVLSWVNQYMVAIPTWLGAFHSVVGEMGEEKAARYADKIVRETHGSGAEKDLSKIQSPGGGHAEFFKLFTMYQGYHNTQFNLALDAGLRAGRGEKAAALHQGFWTLMMAPVIGALFAGKAPQDAKDWPLFVVDHILRGAWAPIPIARSLADAELNQLEGKPKNYELSGVERAATTTLDALGDLTLMSEHALGLLRDKQVSSRAVQHLVEAPGYFLGVPTGQLATSTQYLSDVAAGREHPKDAGELVSRALFGKPPKEP